MDERVKSILEAIYGSMPTPETLKADLESGKLGVGTFDGMKIKGFGQKTYDAVVIEAEFEGTPELVTNDPANDLEQAKAFLKANGFIVKTIDEEILFLEDIRQLVRVEQDRLILSRLIIKLHRSR